MTEYAEGQLFQILEDDGFLPESQVDTATTELWPTLPAFIT